MKPFLLLLYTIVFSLSLAAQMEQPDGSVRYGNEWIRPDATYLRVAVAQDGAYRIDPAQVAALGWSLSGAEGERLQLRHRGERHPVLVTPAGVYFIGEQNRGEFDRYLYSDPDAQQLNPRYSMFTDTAVYYLEQLPPGATGLRFAEASHDPDSGAPPVPYIWRTSERVWGNHSMKAFVRISGFSIYYSHFDTAEGYGSRSENDLLSSNGNTLTDFPLAAPAALATAESATLDLRFGVGFDQHRQLLSLDGTEIDSFTNTGWAVHAGQWTIPDAALDDAQLNIGLRGMAGDRDKASIAFARLRYPAAAEADGSPLLAFELAASSQPRTLQLTNLPGGGVVRLFDQTAEKVYTAPLEAGASRFGLPAFAESHQFLLVAEGGWQATTAASAPITFSAEADTPVDFLILTSERLRAGGSAVAEYAAYRSSPTGGGYRVRVATVEDIYERHGYGIARHPQAIRNYLQRLRTEHPELKYLLLIGKGREYRDVRTAGQLNNAMATFWVPTFGYPGSDALISGIATPEIEILTTLATGRIPAINQQELTVYLDKLRATEAQNNLPQNLASKGWMKNVLHLGGGRQVWEQNSIRGHLESMGEIAKEGIFGASVTGIYKTSTDPIETSRLGQIFEVINAGTSLITFFGHSSAGNFDLNIDTPENYDNAGKCPLMLSLGCYSGNHFIGGRSVGEEFLFLPERGALAFGAANSLGFISTLGFFGRKYYENLSGPLYGEGIGEILKVTSIDLAQAGSGYINQGLAEQYNLQGDPAFKLHSQPGPDLVFNPNQIRLEPSLPNAQADSFAVAYQLVNIGQNVNLDSIDISFRQELPSGKLENLATETIALDGPVTNLISRLPNIGSAAIGNNRLLLEIDPANRIPELPSPAAESNNTLINSNGQIGLPFTVVSNTAFPIYPLRYSLVSEAPVLSVSTSNPLAARQTYLLQLDTSLQFSQPIATTNISAKGGIIEWTPDISWQDSLVYYWRVSPDSIPGSAVGYNWESSSFLYLNGTPNGWGQGHIDQWRDNEYQQLYLEPSPASVFAFADNTLDVDLRNQVRSAPGKPYYTNANENVSSPWTWSVREGINVIILSYPRLGYWRNPLGGAYGSVNTASGWPGGVLPFGYPTQEIEDRSNLIDFLENVVPDSAYVIVYSAQFNWDADYEPEEWTADSLELSGKNIFNVLEAEGATQIRRTAQRGSLPYALFYQKGVGLINEQLADSLGGFVLLKHSFVGKWFEGSFQTVNIGPASEWKSVRQHYHASGQPLSSDSLSMKVLGITPAGEENLLRTIPDFEPTIDYDISDISAVEYPQLRLELFFRDEEKRTPPPIRHLIVNYEGLPDLAITDAEIQNSADTLLQGESWGLSYRVVNLSSYATDTTSGNFSLTQLGRLDAQQTEFSIPQLAAGASWPDTISVSTDSLFSKGNFSLQVNPANQPKEAYRFNNVLTTDIDIRRDEILPVVSVAFDGRPILNGDIVAPEPSVRILLVDENQRLRLDNPELLRIRIRKPSDADFMTLTPSEYEWMPAPPEGENQASIVYNPTFTEDGIYELQVAGQDRSGNTAGRLLYEVSFEVVTRKALSNVLPYPNPFSTATRFVYTLTGAEPTDFRIQIMTVSGRIVREITKAELGPLAIGTHQTEYAWDGRDQYGDQLANGVYLYRVIARDEENTDFELRTNGTEQYFRNGIGKIVLLR